MEPLWRVYLFDGPRLLSLGGGEVRRFRSQRVAAFLAYLALRLGKDVSREELAEALWPEEDPKVTANRLRVSLTSLRHQLEPAGVAPGSVLDASRSGYLRLRRESVWCDVDAFDSALEARGSCGGVKACVWPASSGLLRRLDSLRARTPRSLNGRVAGIRAVSDRSRRAS